VLLILINGANNSGKDQFVEFFAKHYKFKTVNLSTIDRVKELSEQYFGWNGKKTEEARKFLAEMKRIWAEFNNGPFLYTVKKIKSHLSKLNKKNKDNIVYFVHCREPEEIQKFKDKYKDKCLAILLERKERPESKKIANNHADMGVDNYNYDVIISNNGSKIDLELESIKFIEEIKNKSYPKEYISRRSIGKIVDGLVTEETWIEDSPITITKNKT